MTKSSKTIHRSHTNIRRTSRTQIYLPLELQMEILSTLRSETVLRLRRVCRDWNSLTQHHTFVCSNLSRRPQTMIPACLVFQTKLDGKPSFAIGELHDGKLTPIVQFPPELSPKSRFHLVCSCNGLVCFVEERDRDFGSVHLCNPLLRESVKLPELGKYETNIIGVGYDPGRKQFKVLNSVRMINKKDHPMLASFVSVCSVSVEDGGRVGKWRELGVCPDLVRSPPVPLHGRIHWYGMRDDKKSPSVFSNEFVPIIVSFDVQDEKFYEWSLEKLNLPRWKSRAFHSRKVYLALGEVRGRLALMEEKRRSGRCCIRVWTMEEYGNDDSWSLKFSVDVDFSSTSVELHHWNNKPVFCYGTTDYEFCVCYQDVVACYSTRGSNKCSVFIVNDIFNSGYFHNRFYVAPFVGSLVSLKGSPRQGDV